jgi:hypothetical protein
MKAVGNNMNKIEKHCSRIGAFKPLKNLTGIMHYEILHLVTSRTYYYMILTSILFSFYILFNLTISGFHGTAPFSNWTFSMFLSLITPFLSMTMFLLSGSVFSSSEKAVRTLIFSAPVSENEYYVMKTTSVAIATLIVFVLPLIICLVFYARYFDFYYYSELIMPVLLFYVPPFIFTLGLAMLSGRIKAKLPYLLLPLLAFIGFFNLKLPFWFDIFGNNFLSMYPFILMSQSGGSLPYIVPGGFVFSRLVLIIIGSIMLSIACMKSKNLVL